MDISLTRPKFCANMDDFRRRLTKARSTLSQIPLSEDVDAENSIQTDVRFCIKRKSGSAYAYFVRERNAPKTDGPNDHKPVYDSPFKSPRTVINAIRGSTDIDPRREWGLPALQGDVVSRDDLHVQSRPVACSLAQAHKMARTAANDMAYLVENDVEGGDTDTFRGMAIKGRDSSWAPECTMSGAEWSAERKKVYGRVDRSTLGWRGDAHNYMKSTALTRIRMKERLDRPDADAHVPHRRLSEAPSHLEPQDVDMMTAEGRMKKIGKSTTMIPDVVLSGYTGPLAPCAAMSPPVNRYQVFVPRSGRPRQNDDGDDHGSSIFGDANPTIHGVARGLFA